MKQYRIVLMALSLNISYGVSSLAVGWSIFSEERGDWEKYQNKSVGFKKTESTSRRSGGKNKKLLFLMGLLTKPVLSFASDRGADSIVESKYTMGENLLLNQEYNQAAKWFEEAADQGHVESQIKMGDLNYQGHLQGLMGSLYSIFTGSQYEEARKWYKKAAEQGSLEAKFKIGESYMYGLKDPSQSLEWYEKAAEGGYVDSQYRLGNIYKSGGFGLEINNTKSLYWYEKAAEQGKSEAQITLGSCYQSGCLDLDKNLSKAVYWIEKAVEGGREGLEDSLGVLHILQTVMNVDESYEPQIIEFIRGKAEQEVSPSRDFFQVLLGGYYEMGRGVDQDYKKAKTWYELSIKNAENPLDFDVKKNIGPGEAAILESFSGISEGSNNLGQLYAYGKIGAKENFFGSVPNYEEAKRWFDMAADQGHPTAEYNLGNMYYFGRGVEKNYGTARYWYDLSAEKGLPYALHNLGVLYRDGLGGIQDYEEAFGYFSKSASLSFNDAFYNQALMMQEGKGVEQDGMLASRQFKLLLEDGYKYNHTGVIDMLERRFKWEDLSINKKDPHASMMLGWEHTLNWGIVPTNCMQAKKYYEEAIKQGSVLAEVKLGFLYSKLGYNKEAVKMMKGPAKEENFMANHNLGIWYRDGVGVDQDYLEAKRFLKRAAESGYTESQSALGEIYYRGWGVSKDYGKARKWFKKSEIGGGSSTLIHQAGLYSDGLGGDQDYIEARRLYKKAADQGHVLAFHKLAELYEQGLGGEKDYHAAKVCYEQAEEKGLPSLGQLALLKTKHTLGL